MATPSFNIAQDAIATFAAGAWLSDKTDDGAAVAEADSATTCAAVWANGVDEANIQTNEVFQGSRAIDGLAIGTGLDATARLDFAKTDAGAVNFLNLYAGTTGTAANLRWAFNFAADEDFSLRRYDAAGSLVDSPLNVDWATAAFVFSGASFALTTAGGTTTFLASGGVQSPVSGGYRTVAANAAVTLLATDSVVEISRSNASITAVTMTATYTGHRVRVAMSAYSSTGTYTLACTRGATVGTMTLNAAGAWADFVYSGSAWKLVAAGIAPVAGAVFA